MSVPPGHCMTSQTLESDCILQLSFPVHVNFHTMFAFLITATRPKIYMPLKEGQHDLVLSSELVVNTGSIKVNCCVYLEKFKYRTGVSVGHLGTGIGI